ncbi:cell wall-binding repeat-containing protein [Mobiluncus mulieris]|uniref:cell wall-binding repeat-containing protein n=1 Tax=Mobiluncus mulieris TaxID=2052 RepID=UPI00201D54F8|nr:cell wall-binding repeat-containing protein [Mobiluncus mulieris]
MLKKFLVSFAAVALLFTGFTSATPSGAAAEKRIAGANRYDTSLAIAQRFFPNAQSVFVATGKNFPDALAAGPVAATKHAPILLVGDSLNTAQVGYLKTLTSPQITVLGGFGAVSESLETQLAQYGKVTRISGASRYETAAQLASQFGQRQQQRLYLATGTNFADALAGGALAARENVPLMLIGSGTENLARNVASLLGVTQTIVLGGNGAVPDALLTGFPNVKRIYGENRFETASQVFTANPAQQAFLASGMNFPDALSIVPAAGVLQMPLLLAKPSCSPVPPTVPVTFVGGTSVLSNESTAACPRSQANPLIAVLLSLPVKGRAPKTGYDRQVVFGPSWKDIDRNGCDTRNDILARDLTNITFREGTNNCVVTAGLLADAYSGTSIQFAKAQASQVQIDHVVALMDAWQKGAQQLTQEQREQLANDPINLLAVSGKLNQQKGAGDAATWLPPNHAYRCTYVSRQVIVKQKYHLWVTPAEREAILNILQNCDASTAPNDRPIANNRPRQAPSKSPQPSPTTAPSAPNAPTGGVCPAHAPIKGNANSMIYHMPGQRFYNRTIPEACFATESDARAAGYRKAKR